MMKVHAGNSRINGAALIYFFKLFVVLFGIWILLSGKFEVKFLAAGLLTALGTAYLFLPLLRVWYVAGLGNHEVQPFRDSAGAARQTRLHAAGRVLRDGF